MALFQQLLNDVAGDKSARARHKRYMLCHDQI
jgi:hypothetical protein